MWVSANGPASSSDLQVLSLGEMHEIKESNKEATYGGVSGSKKASGSAQAVLFVDDVAGEVGCDAGEVSTESRKIPPVHLEAGEEGQKSRRVSFLCSPPSLSLPLPVFFLPPLATSRRSVRGMAERGDAGKQTGKQASTEEAGNAVAKKRGPVARATRPFGAALAPIAFSFLPASVPARRKRYTIQEIPRL